MESNKKTVKELREELGALGAKRTGNKKTLEKRLENWNKHNINSTLVAVQPIPASDQTAFENIKKYGAIEDMNSEELKWLTFEVVRQYFGVRNALKSFKEGRKLHVANHLQQIGFAKTLANNTQVRCFCKAAMKKGVLYRVIVELTATKNISKSTCTCPAGQGNSAACKHVAALLLCLECYLETGTIFIGASCTSELQQWHKPPKLDDENLSGTLIDELFPSKSSDPSAATNSIPCTPSEEFTTFAVNASINHGLHTSFNIHRNCNMIALFHDHDYITAPFEDYVNSINMVSEEEIDAIEKQTLEQSGSVSWFEYRKSRLTASNIHSVITAMETSEKNMRPPSTVPSKRNFDNIGDYNLPQLAWGKEKEDVAFDLIKSSHSLYNFRKCGLFIDKNRNYLAGSPDGISECRKIVLEIKAPYSIRNQPPSSASCWDRDGKLRRRHPYYSQVQYQMYVTNAESCIFAVYTLNGVKAEKVDLDNRYIISTIDQVDKYYKHVFCEQFCVRFGINPEGSTTKVV